ncbi:hypothetical protein GW781_01000 [bacterium]|nr:hypothetical protein [bacterium]
MSQLAAPGLRLNDAQPIVADILKAQAPARRGGHAHDLERKMSVMVLLAALAAVGARYKNNDETGNALVILPGAAFGEEESGRTTLAL